MDVQWNPPQPHLYVVKRAPTYIVYASKKQVFRQFVDKQGHPLTWPELLFENNVYVGPLHEIFAKGVQYADEDIALYTNLHSQHGGVILWEQLS
jgi:hypothetical protein